MPIPDPGAALSAAMTPFVVALTPFVIILTTIAQTWYQQWRSKIEADRKEKADAETARQLAAKTEATADKVATKVAVAAERVSEKVEVAAKEVAAKVDVAAAVVAAKVDVAVVKGEVNAAVAAQDRQDTKAAVDAVHHTLNGGGLGAALERVEAVQRQQAAEAAAAAVALAAEKVANERRHADVLQLIDGLTKRVDVNTAARQADKN